MRKSLLLIAVMLISFAATKAQSCLPEGITFNTQEQIDNFQTNYPGCTEIAGNVKIQGAGITNLNGLSVLTSISGNFEIRSNSSLVNLEGLEGLNSIEGNFLIRSNYALISLAGLDNLITIGGTLLIFSNSLLDSFTGLGGLTTIGGNLEIKKNGALISLTGLENLISIRNDLQIGFDFGNPSLINLTGLDNLISIGNRLLISRNSSLSTCNNEWLCNILEHTGGSVSISNNAPGCNSIVEVAQSCGGISCLPYGNYDLFSQNDIDNFELAFPGCSHLQGNMLIRGNSINNLNGLSVLTSIESELVLNRNNSLTSLTGLNNLVSIGGNLTIVANKTISGLSGLEALTSIGGNLSIQSNANLTSISELNNLSSIAGSLEISRNLSLSTCDSEWLCSLISNTGESVSIHSNVSGCNSVIEIALSCGGLSCLPYGSYGFYSQNDIDNFSLAFPGCSDLAGMVVISGGNINNLNGLSVLSSINGELKISNTSSLTNLSGLNNLGFIGGDLRLHLTALLNLTGLEGLASVYKDVRITYNSFLRNLEGLDNLTNIGGHFIVGGVDNFGWYGNSSLKSMDGLNSLTSVGGDLRIVANDSLTSLGGLSNLQSVEGDLVINGSFLTSLLGLGNLTYIAKDFRVLSSDLLVNYQGLERLSSVGGNFVVWNNPSLKVMTGLEHLTYIGGNLEIDYNDTLSELTGLEGLTSIGGDLIIGGGEYTGNPSLTSLTGLVNLTSIGGQLTLWNNPSLTSLAGLDSIAAGSISNLYISNNTSLSTCEVKSICDYLAAPNGNVDISDNAPGCNNPVEILEACESSSIEVIPDEDGFTIFPNPFANHLNIEFALEKPCRVVVTVYNNMGQLVAKPEENELQPGLNQLQWDSSSLTPGIYLLHLQVGQEARMQKIIKVQ